MADRYGIQVASSSGDGFLAVSHSTYWRSGSSVHDDANYHPAQEMYRFYRAIDSAFDHMLRFMRDEKYTCRQAVILRAALHYGRVYRLRSGTSQYFFGDALNVGSRLLDSQLARTARLASSWVFCSRFHRRAPRPKPAEMLNDQNKYPGMIEVYDIHDSAVADHTIERVREFSNWSPHQLDEIIRSPAAVSDWIKGLTIVEASSASVNCRFRPNGATNDTSVELAVVPLSRPLGRVSSGPGCRLRVRQTGFETLRPTVWKAELRAWPERLEGLAPNRPVPAAVGPE